MANEPMINSAHQPGNTCIAFARDGSRIYTGGSDSLVRIWRTERGADQEPDSALEAMEGITTVAAGNNSWFSGSEDAEVRHYAQGKSEMDGLITSANGVAIRSISVDPKGKRIAVTSDEATVKVIDLEDTKRVSVLSGHTKGVRKATWHPSGSILTTCGADGKIIAWDVSDDQAKEEKVIEGIIPAVNNTESPEFAHDCSALWHTSGQYFFVATRAHELITVSRDTWTKSTTFSDDSCSGAITALALSKNGVYLASASASGVFIWSTQTRRLLFRFQGSVSAAVTQLAFSPTQNLLAWTDMDGVLTRWPEPIPSSSPDPVKAQVGSSANTVPIKRKGTPSLFDDVFDGDKTKTSNADDLHLGDDLAAEFEDDDWILDDLGGGLKDDDETHHTGKEVREMVSVTKAQPPFQPGATPMDKKKRYLAYNMIGVIEVTDQDTHHIVNVEFHDRSARKGYHFTDHSKYDLASLGERGAVYACQPENDHPAHVLFKPYGTWATQGEWTYELPPKTKVLGIAAGGPPPMKSLREKSDADIEGYGNVVIATSANELIFLTGTGIERYCISFQGDFVSMVAGPEWVFVVNRDGATTMDGSQNLTGRLIKFDDFCLLQKDTLPIPKRHTLKWIGITEEGAPAIYDSSGVLNILPRFRVPFAALWTRVLDTNTLERREGKDESYWPVGVTGNTFMCIILKGRQDYPAFPRPLIQELPLRLPFKRTDPKEGPLEEHLAREGMLLDILRDGLDDELTTDDIARRELALDKELIQLIQNACKNDKLARALDLTKLLHLTASFDMAIKVAAFYHLIGLQEKMEALKEDRESSDRLADARERRRQRTSDLAPIPAARAPLADAARSSAFQDFRPPPPIYRPGLSRAAPSIEPSRAPSARIVTTESQDSGLGTSYGDSSMDSDYTIAASASPEKRKRVEEDEEERLRDSRSPGVENGNGTKRRAVDSLFGDSTVRTAPRNNPFARKPGNDASRGASGTRNNVDANKSKDRFFTTLDEADKAKRPAATKAGKSHGKEKKDTGKQTRLPFAPPPVAPHEKKAAGRKKKAAATATVEETQSTEGPETGEDSQMTEVTFVEGTQSQTDAGGEDETQSSTEAQQAEEVSQTQDANGDEGTPAGARAQSPVIEWPSSPAAERASMEVEAS